MHHPDPHSIVLHDEGNEIWKADEHGVRHLRDAVAFDNPYGMRLVGFGLIASGYSLDRARAWLARTLPDVWQQHRVSEAWDGLDFVCGSRWLH